MKDLNHFDKDNCIREPEAFSVYSWEISSDPGDRGRQVRASFLKSGHIDDNRVQGTAPNW